jgi:predicted acyltransferase
MKTNPSRLLALDIMRGITIAGMILVNNPGSWQYVYAPLRHAEWNGLTPTDLVFPFFMFIMGVSAWISLSKYEFKPDMRTIRKILRRTLLIFLIGLALAWIGLVFRKWQETGAGTPFLERMGHSLYNFEQIRILGVLQRLALAYGGAALIAVTVRQRFIPWVIAGLLAIYTIILFLGKGFEYNETNLLSIVDRAVLGINHVYKDNGIEPEGILSTIPSIAHVLIGISIGRLIMTTADVREKLLRLLLAGAALTFAGFLLSYGCPVNKKIWSPTFVLVTCGLGSTFLALLVWTADVKGRRNVQFFEAFGVNPLYMYVIAALLSILLGSIRIGEGDTARSIHGIIYGGLRSALGDYPGSVAYALVFVFLVWMSGYHLYKKKIYIKI